MATKKKTVNGLAQALKFVMIAQRKNGEPYQKHVIINAGYMLASDGIITAGHPVPDDVQAVAHSYQLEAALKRCGDQFSIHHETGVIMVTAGRFRGRVQCMGWGSITSPIIAPEIAPLPTGVVDCLGELAPLVPEKGDRVTHNTVYLGPNFAVSTNGHALLQIWHGCNLPDHILLSKTFCKAFKKVDKPVRGFGYNESSFAVYFEDGSFLQTQLFKDKWPDLKAVINDKIAPKTELGEFYDVCKTLAEFANEQGTLFYEDGKLATDYAKNKPTTYAIEGLPENMAFNSHDVVAVCKSMTHANYEDDRKALYFFGEGRRAIISRVRM